MCKTAVLSVILLLGLLPATAQTFLERLQEPVQGQGTVSVTQSDSISYLVNWASVIDGAQPAGVSKRPDTGTNKSSARTATKDSSDKDKSDDDDDLDVTIDDAPDDYASEGRKKVMHRSYKTDGYRVQAYAGGSSKADKQKAEQTGNAIKANFPDEPIYVHFYSPRWICRVGNYRTYEEAYRMLLAVRELGYTQASIVKGKISVQY